MLYNPGVETNMKKDYFPGIDFKKYSLITLSVLFAVFTGYGQAYCQSNKAVQEVIEGITMLPVPAGTFEMGSNKGENREKPVHTVTLDSFLMGKTEITQGQYKAITGKNPSNYFGDDKLPVDRVSWYDAVKFCNLLSDKAGFIRCYDETTWVCDFSKNGFRLPTEAEWEYTCRAGTKTVYYSGNTVEDLAKAAWYGNIEIGNSDNIPHFVGMKAPNKWGFYDMHGSVWDWCNDWYDENYYKSSPGNNPKGPSTGKMKVMRGGSWVINPELLTSSYREPYVPDLNYLDIGFRIVRKP
jgi:formylglycine-generating enzyme